MSDYIQVLRELGRSLGKTFYKNSVIFYEGSIGDEVYFIVSGQVKIVTHLSHKEGDGPAYQSQGAIHELATLETGDIFGEMAILDNRPRSASAIAIEDTEVITFTPEDFYINIERYPKLAVRFLKQLSRRIRSLDEQLKVTIAHSMKNG